MKAFLRTAALAAGVSFVGGTASAAPEELRGLVGAEQPAGCSDYSFLFWDFYRAELWSDAQRLPGETFALSLIYRTSFTRAELVDSSIDEMLRISDRPKASFAEVRRELENSFRDVVPGDRITAWRASPDRLRLFLNGAEIGVLTREVDLFFSIWLGADSRHQEGREALLGGRCNG
ncbi:MAG TPA: hypothetical protein VMY41_15155 [Thermohalobaculum sp.]|nr:hypothetical protein [Thermohalobaculum sp.]